MDRIRVCVVGYGNVGKEAAECIRQAPDMELAGIVRRQPASETLDCPVVTDVSQLDGVRVAILAVPTRLVPDIAPQYLSKGISTVDSFDIHGEAMVDLKRKLDAYARYSGTVAVVGAGWDPGTDSVVRMLFMAMAPRGVTYTNFGPGMSMGHTVAVRAIPGVRKALSMTIPAGFGMHQRHVYVELEDGADFQEICRRIKEDPYFAKDDTRVIQVDSVESLESMGHGVCLERYGSAGSAHNLVLQLRMRLTNPSATAQVMVAAARAATRLAPGAYVLGEIPPIDLLPGNRDDLIRSLV